MNDDYLWDKSGAPDPEIAALERALREDRWTGELPGDEALREAAAGTPSWSRRRRHPLQLVAAAIVIALLAWGAWWQAGGADDDGLPPGLVDADGARGTGVSGTPYVPAGETASSYRFEVLTGAPSVPGAPLADRVLPGQMLVTDDASRARVQVGDIGSVTIEPGTRLRIETVAEKSATDAEHLLYLERGTLRASIFAAPRLFQLGTPGGIAVDMGCVYSATVDAQDDTWLGVDVGVVSFEAHGRAVTVPAGASTRADPVRGPGTPVWDDAPADYRDALARLDAGSGSLDDLDQMLHDHPEVEHTLALWHLRDNPDARIAQGALSALLALSPPSGGAAAEQAVRAGDPAALAAWQAGFPWTWNAGGPQKAKAAGQ